MGRYFDMINSADEFVSLRASEEMKDYMRAIHEESPIEVWLDLIARYPEMRVWVAINKTVPLEILKELATDRASEVRSAVADKRKLDLELFDILSKDRDAVVRQRIAYNKKTPVEILKRLAEDEHAFVRDVALDRLA